MIKYIFWDSDNTLLETGELHWRKHWATLKHNGIMLHDEFRPRVYENNGAQNWKWMNEELGLDVPLQDYLNEIDEWYFNHLDEVEVRPGVREVIAMFKGAKCRQAVVSNGRRRSVMAALQSRDIVPFMEFILCKEDYEGRKPDPAPYLAGLKKMTEVAGIVIDAATCLVIEDDRLGVASAHEAGMKVIHRPYSQDDMPSLFADYNAFREKDFLAVCRTAIAE